MTVYFGFRSQSALTDDELTLTGNFYVHSLY